jgi:ParB-like chromosome segregation protein Spo0J
VAALALIENIQREDLNPVEEARAYKRLAQLEDMPHMEIAKLVGKSRSHVANFIRLLGLPAGVLEHLEARRLEMGHARALIGHADAEALAERAVNENLSVRDVEKLARKAAGDGPAAVRRVRRAIRSQDADIVARAESSRRSAWFVGKNCRRQRSPLGLGDDRLPHARPARPDLPALTGAESRGHPLRKNAQIR